ncbi:MAG: hypothetical protein JO092_11010, partial [Candidatus Eremiobacteraeota bacterium]|nr:hypothetical protein [Candidatus Eremiobacteraeota bacterium]
ARVSTNREKNVRGDASENVIQTSVVVLVNSVPQINATPTLGAAGASPLTPANVQLIRNAVIAAADLNVAQGDEVSVELVPFRRDLAPMAMRAIEKPLWILAALGTVAVVGTLALLVLRLRSPLPRQNGKPEAANGEIALAGSIPPPPPATREHMIEYVASVARENPESLAKLVKLWLAE